MSEPLASPASSSLPSPAAAAEPRVAPVRPPQTLLADSAVALVVVAVCAWQRNRFLDITDNWLLAFALFFPVGNLLGLALSLGAYKLRVGALHYRMALGALFTLYYGYVALHVAGLHESPLGTLLMNAAGDGPRVKLEVGVGLFLLLLQTFIATDACQRTLMAMHPPLVVPGAVPVPATAAAV